MTIYWIHQLFSEEACWLPVRVMLCFLDQRLMEIIEGISFLFFFIFFYSYITKVSECRHSHERATTNVCLYLTICTACSTICHSAADRRGGIKATSWVNGGDIWWSKVLRWGCGWSLQELAPLPQPVSSHTPPLHPHHPPYCHTR